jgi:TP901 family phage tail tape measure protein
MAAPIQVPVDFDYSSGQRTTDRVVRDLEKTFERLGRSGKRNLRPLGEGLSAATASASEFDKSLAAANARVIAFGASAGIVVKVQQAFSALVKSTIDVEKSLKDINVILGASEKQLSKFGTGLFKVAKETGQTFETVAAAATELSRQGLSAEKTLQRTKDAMILARLAGMDAVSAVDALTATLNTFTDAGLNSTKVVNKLAKVDAAFAVSSQDLAQALQRVGASAKGAGVSFDELLAIVTAAQQKTARGGAVIGNSFKTIFTRIQRPEVLNQLEKLGIAVRDLQGNTLPAIRILDGLSRTFDTLSDSQKSIISEQVAGVFQINILKAALSDLNSEYGIYQGALRAASSATNEAVQRNQELNTTVAALLNQTIQSFKELGSTVGAISLAPAMKDLLGGVNTVLGSLTEAAGTQIGQGILSGIGKFIGGPGLAIAGVIGGKLLFNFVKFSKEALSTLMGQNNAAAQQRSLQQNIVALLSQQPNLLAQIQSGQIGANQVAQAYLNTLREQQRLQASIGSVAAGAARAAYTGGARVRGGTVKVPGFALATTPVRAGGDGMIPNFAAKTSKEIFGAAVQAERTTSLTNIAAGKQIGAVTFSPAQQRAAASVLARRKAGQKQEKGPEKSAARIHQSDSTLLAYDGVVPPNGMSSYTFKKTKLGEPYTIKFPVASFKKDIEPSPNLQQSIEKFADEQILVFASKFKPTVNQSGLSTAKAKSEGYQGALASTVGAMFESGMRLAFGNSVRGTTGGTFDVAQMPRELAQYFKGKIIGPKADFKNSISDGNRKNFANKIIRDEKLPVFAKNLMPNFSALGAAIAREKAAGIPSGAIRVGRSSQLVGPSNPQGLAVYNTIDEPRGLSQGINRYKSAGLNPKTAGMPNFAGGFAMPSSLGLDVRFGSGAATTLSSKESAKLEAAIRKRLTQYEKGSISEEKLTKTINDLAKKVNLSAKGISKLTAATSSAAQNITPRARGGFGVGGIATSFGLSMAAGFIPQDTAGGRAASTFTESVAAGSAFGPYGMAAGALVGTFRSLTEYGDHAALMFQKNNKEREESLNNLTLAEAAVSAKQNGEIEKSAAAYAQLNPETQALIGGFENLSAETLASAKNFVQVKSAIKDLEAQSLQAGQAFSGGFKEDLADAAIMTVEGLVTSFEFIKTKFTEIPSFLKTQFDEVVSFWKIKFDEFIADLKSLLPSWAMGKGNSKPGYIPKNSPYKFSKGGIVTGGSGGIDDVPALLTAGEFVVKESAVKAVGADFLNKINNKYAPMDLLSLPTVSQMTAGPQTDPTQSSSMPPGSKKGYLDSLRERANEQKTQRQAEIDRKRGGILASSTIGGAQVSKILEGVNREDAFQVSQALYNAAGANIADQKTAILIAQQLKDANDQVNAGYNEQANLLKQASEAAKPFIEKQRDITKLAEKLRSFGRSESSLQSSRLGVKLLSEAIAPNIGGGKLRSGSMGAADKTFAELADLKNLGILDEGTKLKLSDAGGDINKITEALQSAKVKTQEEKEAVDQLILSFAKLKQQNTIGGILGENFRFDAQDQFDFLMSSVDDLSKEMKGSFQGAFKSFIDGSKNASEAFRGFALTILDKLTDMSLTYATNSLFAAGKSAFNFARGGMVNGGSGVRDDVPAMLMGGEYVVKKSAVDALGVGFLNRINSYAEGGVVASNQFQKGTLGTRGSFNVGKGLSALAITSDLNPQNALRDQMAQEDEQRVQRYLEYQERKKQAMDAYKQMKRQRRIGGVISAATSLIAGSIAAKGGEGRRRRASEGPLMEDGSFYSQMIPFSSPCSNWKGARRLNVNKHNSSKTSWNFFCSNANVFFWWWKRWCHSNVGSINSTTQSIYSIWRRRGRRRNCCQFNIQHRQIW